MESSPKGREIEHVEGNPGDIITRGQEITTLGERMHSCADTLESIKNNAIGDGSQKGQAIEKLKESVGDSHETLREAGDLYQPVGPVIKAYGEALDGAQPTINNSADACEDKWAVYESLPGDAEGSTTPQAGGGFLGVGGHDADSQEAKDEAADNAAKKAAYEDWLESAQAFDAGYDTWEDAFDTAVNGVEDELAGSIKDSFWSTLADALEIVAVVVGVAALIIGGPILAALALAVGALLVVATLMSYINGERSVTDIVFATVAILPFGKIAKISGMAKVAQAVRGGGKGVTANLGRVGSEINAYKGLQGMTKYIDDIGTKGLGATIKQGDGLAGLYARKGQNPMLTKLFTGSERGFTDTYRFHKSLFEGPGAINAAGRNGPLTGFLAGVDFGSSAIAHNLDSIKFLSLVTPNADFEIKIKGPMGRVLG